MHVTFRKTALVETGATELAPECRGGRKAVMRYVRSLGFDYQLFHVLRASLGEAPAGPAVAALPGGYRFEEAQGDEIASSWNEEIRHSAWYGGQDSAGFVIRNDAQRVVCLQWYWFGQRYRQSAFWTIGGTEAVSMHLVTVPAERRRGLATQLKQLSAAIMRERGFTAAYSRVWWTNEPSLRVNRKCGWTKVGATLRLTVPWRTGPYLVNWER